MKQIHYIVYKTTNLVNGKIYIGAHKTSDLNDGYMGSGVHLKRSQEKYGLENFKTEILYELESLEEMYSKEAELVNEEFLKRNDVYNIKLGGQGGFDYINSNGLNIGFKFINDNNLNNISGQCYISANKIKESDRYKEWFSERIRVGVKQYYQNNESVWSGKTHTEETKKKMSESHKDKHKGERNSQFGTLWIYNLDLKESKQIKKNDLPKYENLGWVKGRKMKF